MKRFSKLFICLVVGLTVIVGGSAFANDSETDQVEWDKFSQNLSKALTTSNPGLQYSAMQLLIQHSENLDVSNDAVFSIMSIYRDSNDEKVRQLALVALHKTHNQWTKRFLSRQVDFEDSPSLQNQIYAILSENESK